MTTRQIKVCGVSDTLYGELEKLSLAVFGKKSVSKIIKKIVADFFLLQTEKNEEKPKLMRYQPQTDNENKRVRIEIRLSAAEYAYLQQMGALHEMSANEIVAQQVRNLIDRHPTHSIAELSTLRLSNVRLLQIGRNINQIAKQMNTSGMAELNTQFLYKILDTINEHTQTVGEVINASRKRYHFKA